MLLTIEAKQVRIVNKPLNAIAIIKPAAVITPPVRSNPNAT
jgi:hypothetical protein